MIPPLTFGRATVREAMKALTTQELTAVRTADTAGAIHHLAVALIALANHKVGLVHQFTSRQEQLTGLCCPLRAFPAIHPDNSYRMKCLLAGRYLLRFLMRYLLRL